MTSIYRPVALVTIPQDEFEIEKECEVAWGMVTDAEITQDKPTTAEFSLKGKKLIARVLSPAGAKFVVESTEQELPQKTNKGVSRLMVRLPEAKGHVRLAVLLSPVWEDGVTMENVELKPLAEW